MDIYTYKINNVGIDNNKCTVSSLSVTGVVSYQTERGNRIPIRERGNSKRG